jgi:hypothetical protein
MTIIVLVAVIAAGIQSYLVTTDQDQAVMKALLNSVCRAEGGYMSWRLTGLS